MKKLVILALLAAFTLGCSNPGIDEDHDIQLIDKKDVETPTDKKSN